MCTINVKTTLLPLLVIIDFAHRKLVKKIMFKTFTTNGIFLVNITFHGFH
jgi:hypothetical protein